MKTIARIAGSLLLVAMAFVPLLGQWLTTRGPEWMLAVNGKGETALGVGTVTFLFFVAMLLFCSAICCLASSSAGLESTPNDRAVAQDHGPAPQRPTPPPPPFTPSRRLTPP